MSEAITNLGEVIASLVGGRAKTDLTNVDTTGQAYISKTAEVKFNNMMGAPVGSVIAYMGTDEPEGYLLMDGRELNRETYADLFAAIGTSQGAGDGSTTFNIADMTDGRYLMGSTVAGSSIGVKGNGKALGISNGTHNCSFTGNTSGAWLTQSGYKANLGAGTNVNDYKTVMKYTAYGVVKSSSSSGLSTDSFSASIPTLQLGKYYIKY